MQITANFDVILRNAIFGSFLIFLGIKVIFLKIWKIQTYSGATFFFGYFLII